MWRVYEGLTSQINVYQEEEYPIYFAVLAVAMKTTATLSLASSTDLLGASFLFQPKTHTHQSIHQDYTVIYWHLHRQWKKGNIIIFINITTKYWTKLQVASLSTKGKGIYCCGLSIEFSLDFLLPFQFTSLNNLVFQSSDFINLFWQSFQETIRLLSEMKVF